MRCLGLFSLGRAITRRGLMIVGWHGVSLKNEHERFGSLFISPESFRRRLIFLKKKYKIITLEEAVRQSKEGRFKPRQAVLTFDDGFYNFAKVTAPILKEFGVTATNYIVTKYMENQRPILTLLVRDMVLSTKCKNINISISGTTESISIGNPQDHKKVSKKLLNSVKDLSSEWGPKIEMLRSLAHELQVDIDDLIKRRVWHALDSTEIKNLENEGFSMQLHTHNHTNAAVHPNRIFEEVKVCQEKLESVTEKKAKHFCYPKGRWIKKNWEALQKAGVESAVTTMQGPNLPQTPLLSLRRVLNGEDRNQLEFEYEMSNLGWLVHVLLHPKDLYTPNEKLVDYDENKDVF